MKRTLVICLTLLAVVVAFTAAVAQKTGSGEVADSFIIETKKMKPKDLKPGVGFSHLAHSETYKISCTDCHHIYAKKGADNTWTEGQPVEKCIACHDMKKSNKKTGAKKLKTAMHKNCQGCHKKLAKEKKDTGPTKKCNQCHTGKLPKPKK